MRTPSSTTRSTGDAEEFGGGDGVAGHVAGTASARTKRSLGHRGRAPRFRARGNSWSASGLNSMPWAVQALQRAGDVRAFHEAVIERNFIDARRDVLDVHPLSPAGACGNPVPDVDEEDLLVSTLLCLRLCSSALGTKSRLPVRNTAVPGTRTMRDCGRRARKEAAAGCPGSSGPG